MTGFQRKQTAAEPQVAAMIFFFLTILTLYSLLHVYIFYKIQGALTLGMLPTRIVIFVMALMIGAPVIVHASERNGLEVLARLMSCIGYTWMGLAFLFFFSSLAIDLYRLIVYAGGFMLRSDLSLLNPSPRFAFIVCLVVTAVIVSYGFFEARSIRTETLTIESQKIPKAIGALTIVQISDVHLGLIVREERLKRILREVRQAQPDIVVCTGDLVDGQIDNLTGLAELLEGIAPRYGKFTVTGNHEFFAGLDQALFFTKRAGFTILRGEAVAVAGIIIAGIDDPTGKYFGLSTQVSERALLSGLPRDRFTLLLKHMPIVDRNALGLFDLQLSGHTHDGQIFPFNLITRLFFPKNAGLFHLPSDSCLYVSRGSGTWGPPIRFLSPPEVTVIKVFPGKARS
jgi:predicted MPP superfamily phosphohydrolase